MFHSLQLKLILAFGFVIFLCLFLAGAGFMWLLRGYQEQLAVNRLADLAQPVAMQARVLERAGASPAQIVSFLRGQSTERNLRILLVDREGRVIEDTHDTLRGRQIERPPSVEPAMLELPALVRIPALRETLAAFWRMRRLGEAEGLVFIAPRARSVPPEGERFFSGSPLYSVVLAVPESSITSAWLQLAPGLGFSAVISLIASVIVAIVISRSISRPIAQMTRASEEMARGNYNQEIPASGKDEVGRLASAFNSMAREVRRSQRMLRDFLANVSHELKTPLTSIQGFSQAMVDGTIKEREEYREAASILHQETSRMELLVNDLLYLSRLESGQLPLERQPVDLKDLLRCSLRRFQRPLQEQGLVLSVEVGELPPITGDARRLEQVLENLLDNAVRHTPPGGTITVKAKELAVGAAGQPVLAGPESGGRPTGWVEISVHNTGSYVPPEDLPRIFERFYQVDKSRSKANQGSGLGLAIAKEIVEAHGGTIEASSQPEQGTEFVVRLPSV